MKSKRKVLIFVQDGVGGAERMSVLIGKNLNTVRYDVIFCLVGLSKESSIAEFIPNGYKIKRIPDYHGLRLMLEMALCIYKEKPAIVFASVLNLNNKILPIRRFFPKIRFIIRCDNYLYTYTERQRRLVKTYYPKADVIIAQTEEMRDELLKNGEYKDGQVVALHNPIDTNTIEKKLIDAKNPYPLDKKVHFVASGRFAYQKGYDLLIKAFGEVKSAIPNSALYILGDTSAENGSVYDQVMMISKELNISDSIFCVGFLNNPYPYIKYADCFVLSSRWEGLPNVLIEALHLGTPAAAFKCIPIIERIILEGKTGFYADKEDYKSFAQCMVKAHQLGRVKTTYKSSTIEEFTILFD